MIADGHLYPMLACKHQRQCEIAHTVDLYGKDRKLIARSRQEHLDPIERAKGRQGPKVDASAMNSLHVEQDVTGEVFSERVQLVSRVS